MGKKKTARRLSLNRVTMRDLNAPSLTRAGGAALETGNMEYCNSPAVPLTLGITCSCTLVKIAARPGRPGGVPRHGALPRRGRRQRVHGGRVAARRRDRDRRRHHRLSEVRAAALLGLPVRTFTYKLGKHKIRRG
jgi:hypothetical protein